VRVGVVGFWFAVVGWGWGGVSVRLLACACVRLPSLFLRRCCWPFFLLARCASSLLPAPRLEPAFCGPSSPFCLFPGSFSWPPCPFSLPPGFPLLPFGVAPLFFFLLPRFRVRPCSVLLWFLLCFACWLSLPRASITGLCLSSDSPSSVASPVSPPACCPFTCCSPYPFFVRPFGPLLLPPPCLSVASPPGLASPVRALFPLPRWCFCPARFSLCPWLTPLPWFFGLCPVTLARTLFSFVSSYPWPPSLPSSLLTLDRLRCSAIMRVLSRSLVWLQPAHSAFSLLCSRLLSSCLVNSPWLNPRLPPWRRDAPFYL